MSFSEVHFHRLKYFLSPQLDLYKNIGRRFGAQYRVLDYGCGNGVGALQLVRPTRGVWGVDCDPQIAELASTLFGHLQGLSFGVSDWCAERPSLTELYDLVVCVEVIEHVDRPHRLLCRFRESVRDDGAVVISTLNHNSQYRKNPGHVGRWTPGEFREVVGHAFPGVKLYDYTLEEELCDDSTRTPMVAVWEGG